MLANIGEGYSRDRERLSKKFKYWFSHPGIVTRWLVLREGIENKIFCILDDYIIGSILEQEKEERQSDDREQIQYEIVIPPDSYTNHIPPSEPSDRGIAIIDMYGKNR